MNLLNSRLKKRFKEIGKQEKERNPLIITRFIAPRENAVWYVAEYEPKVKRYHCFVKNFAKGAEGWISFTEKDLEMLSRKWVPIVRDKKFIEKRASELGIR